MLSRMLPAGFGGLASNTFLGPLVLVAAGVRWTTTKRRRPTLLGAWSTDFSREGFGGLASGFAPIPPMLSRMLPAGFGGLASNTHLGPLVLVAAGVRWTTTKRRRPTLLGAWSPLD